MTTLKDKIHDVMVEYQRESKLEVGDDFEALENAIVEEVKDYFTKIIG